MYPRPAARNQPLFMHVDVRIMQAGNREPGWCMIFRFCAARAARAIRFMDGSTIHSIVGTLASLVHLTKQEA